MPATAVADVFDDNAWEGQFVCGQDNYSFTLIVEESDVSAIRAGSIEFDTAAGAGTYSVRGRTGSRDCRFLPDDWLDRRTGRAAGGRRGGHKDSTNGRTWWGAEREQKVERPG